MEQSKQKTQTITYRVQQAFSTSTKHNNVLQSEQVSRRLFPCNYFHSSNYW